MKFKEYLEIPLAESITEKKFFSEIKKYPDIDTALMNLPDTFTEFYLLNINDKNFNKKLKKYTKVNEAEETSGWGREEGAVKKIRYKGEYITLTYDEDLGWLPAVRFRSVVNALKYIKKLADDYL